MKNRKITVRCAEIDYAHLPSKTHKFAALNNKSKVFDDKRFKKPKHKARVLASYAE